MARVNANMTKFGERVREIRHELGLTQGQVAERVGVKERTLGSWETGDREPSLEMVRRIVIALNCDANYLLGVVGYDGVRVEE